MTSWKHQRNDSLPKFVVSTTLNEPAWSNSSVISGDIPGEVSRLKRQSGNDILIYGSSQLMHTLMRHDLIDEYRFWINPVVVGSGKRLFPDGSTKAALRFVDRRHPRLPVRAQGAVDSGSPPHHPAGLPLPRRRVPPIMACRPHPGRACSSRSGPLRVEKERSR